MGRRDAPMIFGVNFDFEIFNHLSAKIELRKKIPKKIVSKYLNHRKFKNGCIMEVNTNQVP